MTENILDVIEKLGNSYDDSMGDILSTYDFILDPDSEYLFPITASERYKLFKESTCEFHLIQYKYDYLELGLNTNDIHLVNSELEEIKKYLFHDKLVNESNRNILYKEAIIFITQTFNAIYKRGPVPICSDDDIILYLLVLHQNDYFDSRLLPDEAFMIDLPDKIISVEMISEVYAKYILFYDHLIKRKEDIERNTIIFKKNEGIELDTIVVNESIQETELSTLHKLFLPEYKNQYNQVVAILSRQLDKKELRNYQKIKRPLFIIDDGDINKLKLNFDRGKYSFLGALLIYINRRGWISQVPTTGLYKIANDIFAIQIKGHSLFSKINSFKNNNGYMKDIELLLDGIQ